jgi:hypothetical protein
MKLLSTAERSRSDLGEYEIKITAIPDEPDDPRDDPVENEDCPLDLLDELSHGRHNYLPYPSWNWRDLGIALFEALRSIPFKRLAPWSGLVVTIAAGTLGMAFLVVTVLHNSPGEASARDAVHRWLQINCSDPNYTVMEWGQFRSSGNGSSECQIHAKWRWTDTAGQEVYGLGDFHIDGRKVWMVPDGSARQREQQ